jgi:hypothetical protein
MHRGMGSKHFRCLKFGEQICGFPFRANQLIIYMWMKKGERRKEDESIKYYIQYASLAV